MIAVGDAAEPASLRIVHLFPDLLSTYGDGGNIRTLVVRAERREIRVDLRRVGADDRRIPDADLFVIGGGQDRDQLRVERALGRLGSQLERWISDGAALLAVCAGYQNLGRRYRFADGRTIHGLGIFGAETIAGDDRLVGPVVATLTPIAACLLGEPPRSTLVGFENHSGRTALDASAAALANVETGSGNNGLDGTEGFLATTGPDSLRGLRLGTYLHGPFLPRNPHIADALIRAGLARTDQSTELATLDDHEEWAAHDRFVERTRARSWVDRLPGVVRRAIGPVRGSMRP